MDYGKSRKQKTELFNWPLFQGDAQAGERYRDV